MSQNENSEAIAIQPSSMAPSQPVVIMTNGEFRAGLFDCFADCGLCCKTSFLPFLTVKSTQETLPPGTTNCTPVFTCGWFLGACTEPVIWSFALCMPMTTVTTLLGLAWIPQCIGGFLAGCAVYEQREAIRQKDNLYPMGCIDCLIIVFCQCCAIIQHERQTHPTTFVVPVTAQPVATQPAPVQY